MDHTHKIWHLYWRAGFGLSLDEWEEKKSLTTEQAIRELFNKADHPTMLHLPALAFLEEGMANSAQLDEILKKERQLVGQQNVEWLLRMASPAEDALLERMCFFWHGHFACDIKLGQLAGQYLNTLRQHALGHFRNLVLEVARTPAMIRYLNNQQNRKQKPNENFARELMELFTIGRGHYTEQDVKEAARAFTGWSSDKNGSFLFRPLLHDFDMKTFMERSGTFNGEDIVDIILEKKETALFICRKIYRHFVNETVNEDRVRELAERFYKDYDIGALMRYLMGQDWFYAQEHYGAKIKSPVELTAGIMRQLQASVATPAALVTVQRAMGQVLFHPPNVAGWPGGNSWIDNSTLMMRLQLASFFCLASDVDFSLKTELDENERRSIRKLEAQVHFAPVVALCRGLGAEEAFDRLSGWLIQGDVSSNKATVLESLRGLAGQEMIQTLMIRLMTLPEYQVC